MGVSGVRTNRAGAVLIGVGGIALAIAPFLTWVNLNLLVLGDHLTLFNLLSLDDKPKLYGEIIVGVGVAVTVLALVLGGSRLIRLFGLIVAAAVAVVMGPATYRLVQIVGETHNVLGVGTGIYLLAGAEAAFILGALVG
jgi:hypothetical protein